MGNLTFTKEQQRVIDERNATLLVSAAAGSGKTAVLTQRIISLLLDSEHPMDIDRMLIVTFTKAAAAEMRERIANAIAKELVNNPLNNHLQRQSALIHNAQITTIDSFCLFVIRNNFADIGLDPGFRILDEGERKLLQKEIMEQLLEENYSMEDNKDFLSFAESYSSSHSGGMEDLIHSLYEFSMSHPEPEKWLKGAAADDSITDFSELEETVWWRMRKQSNERLLETLQALAQEAVMICGDTTGPHSYMPTMEAWLTVLTSLKVNDDFDQRYELLQNLSVPALSRSVGKEEDAELRLKVKLIRDRISKAVDTLKTECYFDSKEHILAANREIQINSAELTRLTLSFSERFSKAKREKNVIDFADMEHFALNILLTEDDNGNLVPSHAALEYRNYFQQVMVDEYQDSNYVQEYLLKSIASDENYFMVGDVKQSIYRFRLARPEIFMEKYRTFQEEGNQVKIDLNRNFRSRMEVIESVNDVFSEIMRIDTAGMEYDDCAKLYQGADYTPAIREEYRTELMLLTKSEEEEDTKLSSVALEARMVAQRIIKMKQERLLITDKESGEQRPVTNRDIVILVRASGGYDDEFRKVMEEYGIPVFSNVKTGYFQTMEVRTVMNVLRILDNPLQDIPLYGTLHSYFHQFTEEEIAEIRAEQKKTSLYQALKTYQNSKQDDLAEKITHFLKWLHQYRERVCYVNIRELIGMLLQESGYLEYVTALPGGAQRRANLMMLLEKASDFEATSYHGLFHFVRYITQLKEQEVDYGEAGILDENADVVRLMTIHKSKGLEFPVCFLCGLTKRLNKKDATKAVLMEMEYGIALDDINPINRYQRPGFKKRIMARRMVEEGLAEEMRILYVAMTRAKEKLIMTGVVADADALMDKMPLKGTLDSMTILQAVTGLDFVIKALANAGKLDHYLSFVAADDLLGVEVEKQLESIGAKEQLLSGQYPIQQELLDKIKETIIKREQYPSLHGLYTKTTVSELKKEAYEDEAAKPMFEEKEQEAYIPLFARDTVATSVGTKRGSAYHRVMELFPFSSIVNLTQEEKQDKQLQERVKAVIVREQKSGRLSEEYAELANLKKLAEFLKHSVATRMATADSQGRMYKEKAFFLGIPANRVDPDFPDNETLLVQGVIDVYFEEEDGLVVLDYKTDRVNQPEELVERYHKQLEIYAEALEQITGKKVKEKIIFSFAVNREISL